MEAKYRNDLRRPAQQLFVDPEGDIVWTQEYLRYRVENCSNQDATDKVLAQCEADLCSRDVHRLLHRLHRQWW